MPRLRERTGAAEEALAPAHLDVLRQRAVEHSQTAQRHVVAAVTQHHGRRGVRLTGRRRQSVIALKHNTSCIENRNDSYYVT